MKASEVDVDPAVHLREKVLTPKFGVLLKTVNALLKRTGGTAFRAFGPLPASNVADLPDAAGHARSLIYVTDEAGGATIAFSDGSNWRRVQDRAIVS